MQILIKILRALLLRDICGNFGERIQVRRSKSVKAMLDRDWHALSKGFSKAMKKMDIENEKRI